MTTTTHHPSSAPPSPGVTMPAHAPVPPSDPAPAAPVRGPLATVLRMPSLWIGLVLGSTYLVDTGPFTPGSAVTWALPLLALAYLAIGAVRGAYRRRGVLGVQLLGVVAFTSCALVALAVAPVVGQYVVAAGWLAHAGWDLAHRHGRVVPRWYVAFCVPFDVLVAASLVVAATS